MTDEPTGFLYPFIDSEERDEGSLVDALVESAVGKMDESRSLRTATVERIRTDLDSAADEMAARFIQGGRLLTFGNGGSATDAGSASRLFVQPPWGRSLPAMSLVADQAVTTALANDISYSVVFSRQIEAYGQAADIALAFSTSGGSENVLKGIEQAARRGILTLGLAGYEGGAMAASANLNYCFVVRSQSIHRIQEAQSRVIFELWSAVQRALAAQDTRSQS